MSSDTWLHGTGAWRVCLRVLAASFLMGWRPFAQGHWRWNLILTDLPTFPHSGKLGLQGLREGIRLCNPGSHLAWALLEEARMTVFVTTVWLSPDPSRTHSPSDLARSAGLWQLHQPPSHWLQPPGSYGSVPPAEPAAPEALQPADTSAQGWATPQPARPLPSSLCEEATPEDGSLGLQEKEVPKPPEDEAKTHKRGQTLWQADRGPPNQ